MWESKCKAPVSSNPEVSSQCQHMRPLVDSTRQQPSETHGEPTAQTGRVWVCQQVCARPSMGTGLGGGHQPEGLNPSGPVVLPASCLPLKKDPRASVN